MNDESGRHVYVCNSILCRFAFIKWIQNIMAVKRIKWFVFLVRFIVRSKNWTFEPYLVFHCCWIRKM